MANSNIQTLELPASSLRKPCDPSSLNFVTTSELPDLEDVIGQPRAIRALELGSEVSGPGYNTFVLGVSGSGRTTLSLEYLQRKAAQETVPDDWCYVNNFENSRQPMALHLPAGRGTELRKDIQELIQHCQSDLARIFESEEYTHERDRLVNELKKSQEAEFIDLQRNVEKFNFLIARTPFGFVLVPAVEGKPLKSEELEKLSQEQRSKLSQLQSKLSEDVEKSLSRLRALEKDTSQKLSDLNEQTVLFFLKPWMAALNSTYAGLDCVLNYLNSLQVDVIANAERFQPSETSSSEGRGAQPGQQDWSRRYVVNVLVDNSNLKGAPVVYENYPSYTNLLGRIEHEVFMGASRTDFTMIQPGAVHRANGGYLLIPVRDLLINPYAWEGVKRILRDGELRMVELANQIGLLSSVTLEPEPIPLKIKIVIVGAPLFYYLLRAYDEDFAKLFKVRAEFASTMQRTAETEQEYGIFIKSVVNDNQLPPFDRSAVARIIEFSSRMADDQNKLSTRFGKIADLVRESAHWARKTQFSAAEPAARPDDLVVSAQAVQRAIDEGIYRNNLVEERIQEMIERDILMIDVSGEIAGQVNALSVIFLGDYAFGRPSRVTATAYAGRGGVVDIERQAKLGGPIHTKGVLILSGLLGKRYGRERPLSLTASLTFEQTYEGVEGDSASAAEFIALLSAISDLPLRQDRALTGSINQTGQIQAIGGVNEKIEGFFSVCKAKGLSGEQGVLIPATNVGDLMLNDDVIQAVDSGQFHIWSIRSIDDVIRLLANMEPGEPQPDGSYLPDTFNHAVLTRLATFAKAMESLKGSDEKRQNLATNNS